MTSDKSVAEWLSANLGKVQIVLWDGANLRILRPAEVEYVSADENNPDNWIAIKALMTSDDQGDCTKPEPPR